MKNDGKNTVARASLVIGGLGLVAALCAIADLIPAAIAWPLCGVGLVLGVVGFLLSSNRAGAGRDVSIMAITATVVGLVLVTIQPSQPAAVLPVQKTSTAPSSQVLRPSFGEGTYQVGTQIAPGTYEAGKGYSCKWDRLRGLSDDFSEIIRTGFVRASDPQDAEMTVEATDGYVRFEGPCFWSTRR